MKHQIAIAYARSPDADAIDGANDDDDADDDDGAERIDSARRPTEFR